MITKLDDEREWIPVMAVCRSLGISRFTVRRRLNAKIFKGKYDHKGRLHISRDSINDHLANLPEYGEL